MMRLISTLKSALPGVFVHSIRIGSTPEEDRKKSLLDGMNRQISEVCQQLALIPELTNGFNAIGISQVVFFKNVIYSLCLYVGRSVPEGICGKMQHPEG